MPQSDYRQNFLIDSSFHIAYFFEDQKPYHKLAHQAIEYIKKTYLSYNFITTHLIFLETLNTVLHGKNIKRSIHDKKIRKGYADALCQDIVKHCEVRAVPEDMFLDIWELYVSEKARKTDLEYVDCSSFIYMRDVRKHRYQKDHRLSFNSILTFNARHFSGSFAQDYDFKLFDFSALED